MEPATAGATKNTTNTQLANGNESKTKQEKEKQTSDY